MRIRRLLSLAALSLLWACDKATLVAPGGAVLTLTASPTDITLTGASTLTVVARRENGNPVNPGTEVRFSTTLGTLDQEVVETDSAGVATAVLRGDGRVGDAVVRARSGAAESPEVTVTIGRLAGAVSLQANPSSVPETGGVITLLVLVRDSRGQPVANVPVNFRTEVGPLQSGGAFRNTNSQGQQTDRLTVAEADLLLISGDSFAVSVEASGTGGTVQRADGDITILRAPEADFTFTVTARTVVFEDTSLRRPTSWEWTFGDGQRSSAQNPTHTYSADGDFVVTLTATNSIGSNSISQVVVIDTN
jgi:hypothetical protein